MSLSEVEKVLMVAAWLKKKFKVGINLMQIDQRTNDELENIGKIIKTKTQHILYFADSMGGLETKDISKIN